MQNPFKNQTPTTRKKRRIRPSYDASQTTRIRVVRRPVYDPYKGREPFPLDRDISKSLKTVQYVQDMSRIFWGS